MAMGRGTHAGLPMQDSPCRTPHAGVPIELSPGSIPVCADERCLDTPPSATVRRSGVCRLLHLSPTEATGYVDGREVALLRPRPVVRDLVVAHAQHPQPVAERPQVQAPIPAECALVAVVRAGVDLQEEPADVGFHVPDALHVHLLLDPETPAAQPAHDTRLGAGVAR